MINKIIFFIESPLNQRDYNRFGFELLKKNGFELEVWDFSLILYSKILKDIKIIEPIKNEKCYSFLTWKEAQSSILNLKPDCFIVCLISYQFESYNLYKALSKVKRPYCVFMANALPSIKIKRSVLYFNKLRKINLLKIINLLFLQIPINYIGINPASIILAGGVKSTNYNFPINKKTKTLWLHTLDYDIYLKDRNNLVQKDPNMGVFLDEYLPFHPDNILLGLSIPSTAEEYYPTLCKFFDFIEKKYNVQIVIAAHPRSNYSDNPDYFGGRPVFRGKTAELVKRSGFIITHSSTSINFAVLQHKPIIFVTSNRLNKNWKGLLIELMASQLGKKPINLDNPISIDWKKELSINEEVYMNYQENYIKKTGSEELPFWQIFANHIKKKFILEHL
ncbi:MAG: hypothetical protein WC556_01875 [Candidatus Methanoperedens sp.]